MLVCPAKVGRIHQLPASRYTLRQTKGHSGSTSIFVKNNEIANSRIKVISALFGAGALKHRLDRHGLMSKDGPRGHRLKE